MSAAMKTLLALVAAAAFAAPAVAQDKPKPEDKPRTLEENVKVCATCHGEDGNEPLQTDFPKLGGQHYDYLLHSLKGYKSGARKNPIMQPQAQALSTRQMEELARYYAGQKSTLFVIPLHRLARDER
jgi:cytochrome c553